MKLISFVHRERASFGVVVGTGTSGGVGAKRTRPLWMKAGDVVEVDVDCIGVLRNSVVDEV
jgi:2-keto-4-pentenoate hydratase/2-oxohepta-3-ene-1,7-dioic acid hydratase in catechol pathway